MFSFHDEATAFQHGNQGTQTSVHVQETLSFPAEQQFPTHCGKKLSHSWQKDSCRSVAPTMWARSNIHSPSINRVCMFKKYFNCSFRSVAKHSQSQHNSVHSQSQHQLSVQVQETCFIRSFPAKRQFQKCSINDACTIRSRKVDIASPASPLECRLKTPRCESLRKKKQPQKVKSGNMDEHG